MQWWIYLTLGIVGGVLLGMMIALIVSLVLRSRKNNEEVVELKPKTTEEKPFSLSRRDVLDHIEAMCVDPVRFVIPPDVKEQQAKDFPDYLKCAGIYFGVVFERNDCVCNIAVRLDDKTAKSVGKRHTIEPANYLSSDDWYNLPIDQTYESKREVYKIIDAAYDYIYADIYAKLSVIELEAVRVEQEKIEKELTKNTAEVVPPKKTAEVKLFSLSRYDVLDHIEAMRIDPIRFVIPPDVKEQQAEDFPDYLQCGEICFGVVFERNGCVHNIAVRLDKATAKALRKQHIVDTASYLSGDDWYNLPIDQTYESKREVYRIIDDAYDYIYATKFSVIELEAARAEQERIEKEFIENAAEVERAAAEAERSYLAALEKFKTDNYSDFKITRKEVINDTHALNNPQITIVERPEPHSPVSIKYKDKTYVMMYGTDKGIMMIAKIDDAYADSLSIKNPEVRRAKFPAGANWYYVPINGAFENKESVYAVLNAAYGFVLGKYGTKAEIENSEKLIYKNFARGDEDKEENTYLDLTRREIMDYTGKDDNPDITVIDRPMEPQLPVSLKYKDKTYAMMYGTEVGIFMIIKLDNAYAKELIAMHSGVTKAKFPAGPNWYSVPLSGIFNTKEKAYALLERSLKFVQEYKAKAKATTPRKKKQPPSEDN